LVSTKMPESRTERSTCDSAAKCTTASMVGNTVSSSSASRMSPLTNEYRGESATGARFSRFPE